MWTWTARAIDLEARTIRVSPSAASSRGETPRTSGAEEDATETRQTAAAVTRHRARAAPATAATGRWARSSEIPTVLGEVVNGVPVIKSGTDFRNYSRICLHFTDNHLGAAAAARAVAHRSRDGQDGLLVTGGACGQRRSESEWVLEEVVKADVCDAAAQELVEIYREELSRSMDRVIGELGTAMDATFARIRTQEIHINACEISPAFS